MSLVRVNYNPSRAQLAVFGGTWLVFFAAVGGVVLGRGGPRGLAIAIWLAAVVVPTLGWLVPRFMRLVYLGMTLLAFPVGFVVSYVVLAAVYYLVFTPTGLLMRLFGYDPLQRRFDRKAESYWVARRAAPDLQRYFRQY